MVKGNLLSVKDAIKIIIKNLKIINSEDIELTNSLGRINSKKIISKLNNPPYDVSSMDGFAIDSKTIFTDYKVVGESSAGNPFLKKLNIGETIQIYTGAQFRKEL